MPPTETRQAPPTDLPLVLHVIPTRLARGAQREARALADHLDAPGVRTHRVLALFGGPAEVESDYWLDHPGGGSPGVGFDPRLAVALRSELTRLDPSVVIAHGGEPLKYLVPAMIGRHRPLVYYAIGTYSGADEGIQLRMWRYLVGQADAVAAEGIEVRVECITRLRVPPHKVTFTPNGRDPDLFHPGMAARGPSPPLVIFVGALTTGKRPDRFIEVIAALRARGLSLRAAVAGDGPLRDEVAGSAQAAGVELLGSRSDIADVMREADALVFTSRPAGEGMPGVLIEAGLSGLPAVACDVPGVRTIVKDGQTGFVVGVDDLRGTIENAARLLDDPDLRRTLGAEARRHCLEQFTMAAVENSWSKLLTPLVDFSGNLPSHGEHSAKPMSISSPPWHRRPPPAGLPDPVGRYQWAVLYASSALQARNDPAYADIEQFCFFIGYARSGHTLVGTMLNAHPEVVIAHELDAIRFVGHGFRRAQLFGLLLERDQQFGSIGRTWSGYQYEIPGQFQGRFERLRVIGDKRARSAVLQIARNPRLLDRVRKVVGVPIKVIHVTRNPFDNIATEARRHNMTLSEATRWYEEICEAVEVVRPLLDPLELLDLRYEPFAAAPAPMLADLCDFIGIKAEPDYLQACAGLVWPSTRRTRDSVTWSDSERADVERLIDRYEVLHSYSFDN